MKVSVIIPCYNSADTIEEQLIALTEQTYSDNFEVIVADNGSTDNSIDIVNSYDRFLPNLKTIKANQMKGAGYARNKAAEVATGEILLFCDADDVVAKDWIEMMVNRLNEFDIVAPRMEHYKLNDANIADSKSGMQSQKLLQKEKFNPPLPFAGASGLGIKKNLHEIIGGFDERLLANEDWDYCWKAQLANGELYFEPNAVIHIRHRKDRKGRFRQAMFWGEYYPLVVKKYRSKGIKHPDLREAIVEWKIILYNLPKCRNREIRYHYIFKIAQKLGKIKGSIRYKVLAL